MIAWLKKFAHDKLGWHTPDQSKLWFDGATIHSTCKRCGEDIGQDSQGNWFSFGKKAT